MDVDGGDGCAILDDSCCVWSRLYHDAQMGKSKIYEAFLFPILGRKTALSGN
jgi:hypothetical protein